MGGWATSRPLNESLPVRWLRELCPSLPDDANAIAARLTAAGLEVEATHAFGLGAEALHSWRGVVSTRLHRVAQRPAPRDRRPRGNAGRCDRRSARRRSSAGAPNVPEPGGLVVLGAPFGTYLPAKAMTVERRTIAGVPSEGMLCRSEAELGLGDDSDGILVLPAGSVAPGTPLVQGDLSRRATRSSRSVLPPIARTRSGIEVSRAGSRRPLRRALPVPGRGPGRLGRRRSEQVRVDRHRRPRALPSLRRERSSSACGSRFLAARRAVAAGVTRGAVHLERRRRDQPDHARARPPDARVRSRAGAGGARIVVRRAASGEKLRTLDGAGTARWTDDDLVICDGEGPVALAGVMGGGESEITAQTERVLLECAYFEPRGVRRAAPPRTGCTPSRATPASSAGVDWGVEHARRAREGALAGDEAGRGHDAGGSHRRGPTRWRTAPSRASVRSASDGSSARQSTRRRRTGS